MEVYDPTESKSKHYLLSLPPIRANQPFMEFLLLKSLKTINKS